MTTTMRRSRLPTPHRALPGLAFTALVLGAGCADDHTAPFNDAIAETALRADVEALAHDSTRGRLVGTPEVAEVADFIRGRFEALGLAPAGDGGTYDHRFDMSWFRLGEGNLLTVAGAGGARAPGRGWTPLNVSASASVVGEVAFAGYGIVEPRLGWDDYQGADLAGKIVLVLEREPGVDDPESPFDGLVTAHAAREWNKALAAQQHGASAILFVRDVHARADVDDWGAAHADAWPAEPRRIERFLLRPWVEAVTIPGAFVSVELARTLVEGSGRTLEDLALASEEAESGLGVVELPGSRVALSTAVERHVTPGRNVLAMVEGSDPALRDEAVIIVTHHDQNGTAGDTVFNGADDNCSGTAGVLAVAEAYARAAAEGRRPRRTVVFAMTDAEERGPSLGAWHLTLAPPFPLESTVAVFNVDMIGRDQEVPEDGDRRFNGLEPQTAESNANAVNILGYSRTPALAAAVEAANADIGLTLRMRYDNNPSNLLRRSDQWPYLQSGVPAVWFHTGLHPDYHTPFDDAERLNYAKMVRIARLIHQVSWEVANGEARFAVEPMGSRPAS
ncbi:MAG: hypothetical protein AMXMBFR53_02780 [Gemmatimonadota bacterium]